MDEKPISVSDTRPYFSADWSVWDKEGLRAQLRNISRAVSLVWRSSPGWTTTNLGMILVEAAVPIFLLYAFKQIIDATTEAMTATDGVAAFQDVLPILLFAGAIAIVQAGAKAFSRLAQDAQSMSVTNHMLGLVQDQAATIDLRYFEDTRYRNMLFRARREAPSRPARTLVTLLDIGRSFFSLIAMIGLLVTFSWLVLPMLIFATVPGGLVRLFFAGRLHRLNVRQSENMRRAGYYESLCMGQPNAQEVRQFGLGKYFGEASRRLRRRLRIERLQITRMRLSVEFAADTFAVIAMFGVIAVLSRQAIFGAITLGALVMYMTALQRSWANFGQMIKSVADLREHSLFIEDVYQFLDIEPTIAAPALPKAVPSPIRKGIVLDNVSFKYPEADDYTLRNLSMTIRPGNHVAIVGHNGSGKSTLIKLLCRFYDPTEGSITLDGVDLREFDPEGLRHLFGVHLQGYARFQESARQSIALGAIDQQPSDEMIDRAAAISGADAVIAQLPNGYETTLGKTFSGGHELSAGQWQKIALARVFARDAPFIILDEPTASLDAKMSGEFVERLLHLAGERTVLIISHRLSAVVNAECIFVLDEGRLVESGTHEELLLASGRYAQLFRIEKASEH